jgi:hypothetical protein
VDGWELLSAGGRGVVEGLGGGSELGGEDLGALFGIELGE